MSSAEPFVPEVFRTIGYPLFGAVLIFIFKSHFAITLAQIFLVAASGLLMYKIGKKLFTPRVGLIAALVYMFEPTTVFHTLGIFSDILFVFLLVLAIYLLFFVHSYTYKKVLVAGLVLGFAALVRPIALYLIPCLILVYLWMFLKHGPQRKIVISALLLTFASGAFVLPWMICNKIQAGSYSLSSVTFVNMYTYNVPDFFVWKGMSREEAKAVVELETGISYPESRFFENKGKISALTKKYIFADPFRYAYFHISKSSPFIASSGFDVINGANSNAYHNMLLSKPIPKILTTFDKLFWLVMLVGTVLSLILFRKKKRVLLFVFIILYFWILTGPVAYARYRLPADPFLLILGFAAFNYIYFLFKKWATKREGVSLHDQQLYNIYDGCC
jgi:4-amino-4-deoxy-L-arabinose transferase-like glycosyltransferase